MMTLQRGSCFCVLLISRMVTEVLTFVSRLLFPFNTWQDLQASSFQQEGQAIFFNFCDALETREDGSINQSDEGVGMPLALENLASIHKAISDENCPHTGGSCFSTYNYTEDPGYVDVALTNSLRGWQWLLCTQLGVWQSKLVISIYSSPIL